MMVSIIQLIYIRETYTRVFLPGNLPFGPPRNEVEVEVAYLSSDGPVYASILIISISFWNASISKLEQLGKTSSLQEPIILPYFECNFFFCENSKIRKNIVSRYPPTLFLAVFT